MASPFTPDLPGACRAVLEWMDDNIATNNPRFLGKQTGMLRSIKDPMNVGSFRFSQLENRSTGKIQKVVISGYQRRLEESATTTLTCATPADRAPDYEEDIDVTLEMQSEGVTIQEDVFSQICADDPTELARLLADDQRAVRSALDKELLGLVKLNAVGINLNNIVSSSPSADAKTLTILDSAMANLPQAMGELMVDYSTNLLTGAPNIVAQGNLQQFFYNLQMGCCNDAGFDMEKVQAWIARQGVAFWLDQHANAELGTNHGIVYSPGALQLLTINRYTGRYTNNDPQQQRFVVPDVEIPGLFWDVYAVRNLCDDGKGMNSYSFKHQLIWDLWKWPADSFQNSDELNGMTGVFEYEFAQA